MAALDPAGVVAKPRVAPVSGTDPNAARNAANAMGSMPLGAGPAPPPPPTGAANPAAPAAQAPAAFASNPNQFASMALGGVQAKPGQGATATLPAGAAPGSGAPGAMPPGATDMGNNLVKLANGQMVPRDHPLFAEAMKAAGAGATPAATPGATPGAAGQPAAGGPQNAQQALTGTPEAGPPTTAAGAFQQAMLKSLAPEQVTADSDSVRPQIQANQLAQQRGMEQQRAQMAERNAAAGTNMSGGAATQQIGLEQDRAAQEGNFNANAVAGQNDKNQQAQLMMSQLAGGMLTNQGGQDVQKYGIDTGAATSKYGIDQGAATSKYGVDANSALGQGDLALRGQLGKGQLGLGLAGLQQQGNQFDQSLSSNNAQFGAGLNQSALLKMLGL